jgi:hypothetical protein
VLGGGWGLEELPRSLYNNPIGRGRAGEWLRCGPDHLDRAHRALGGVLGAQVQPNLQFESSATNA